MNFLRNLFKNKSAPPPYLNRFSLGVLVGVLCSVLVLSPSPVTAAVGDNLSSAFAVLSEWLGIGKEDSVPEDEDFSTASLVEKVNYLEEQNAALVTKVSNQAETIDRLFSMSVSTAYTDSQVKSTKATVLSPKQVLLQWNLTADSDCTASTSGSSALGDWTVIEKFNVYYGTSSRTSDMTLATTVSVDRNKAFYQNYSYQINGLNPSTTYYFWVTSVIDGGAQLSASSAVRTVGMPSLASAQVTGLSVSFNDAHSLNVSWSGNYSGYVTYKVYCGTSSFTITPESTAKASTSGKSYCIGGLAAQTTYYVGVCAVLNDGNTWVGNSSTSKSAATSLAFASASWSQIHTLLQKGQALDLGWNVGNSKNGHIIIQASSNSLTLWSTYSYAGTINGTWYSDDNVWNTCNAISKIAYSKFNSDMGVHGLAYESGLLSVSMASTGYFTSDDRRKCNSDVYWLDGVSGTSSSGADEHYYCAWGEIRSGGLAHWGYPCHPYIKIH